jgi:hypothetical protein
MSSLILRNTSAWLLSIVVLFPLVSLAQPNFDYFISTQDGQGGLLVEFSEAVAFLIPLLISIALLVFIWGMATFIYASGNEDAIEGGKRKMIWGILALFTIVSVWGLVALLVEITGVQQGAQVTVPDYEL